MTLRAEYRMHYSGLEAFLSAPVWQERNGSDLSVLSAFARLDLDPWEEAGRLAALPRAAAAQALAGLLSRMPPPDSDPPPDLPDLACRLVELLPEGQPIRPAAPQPRNDEPVRPARRIPLTLLLAMAALVALLLAGGWPL